MRFVPHRKPFALALLFFLGVCFSPSPGLMAQGQSEQEAEFGYAEWLNRNGLPDLAEIVLKRANVSESNWRTKTIRLESLLTRGRFDEAKAAIAKEPNQDSQDAWALKITMANYYFMWGQYKDAQAVYDSFFKKYSTGPTEAMKQFYIESAYNYQQMLMMMGDEKGALAALQNILKAKLDRDLDRRIKCEIGDMMVKLAEKYPKEAAGYITDINKIVNEIVWDNRDLWFGKAIVLMAHVKVLNGDMDGAMKLVDDYRERLNELDKMLKQEEQETGAQLSRLSPMAECRFMLGVIMQKEAEKLIAANGDREKIGNLLVGRKIDANRRTAGALQNFVIVFADYSTTTWAPEAGLRAAKIEDLLKKVFPGARVSTTITPDKIEAVRKAQFVQAKVLMSQQQFEEAVEAYVGILNLAPEGEASIAALTDIAQCFIELKNDLYAEMVIRYLAERFSQNPSLMLKAGDEVIKLAEIFANQPEKRDALYDVYFRNFTLHPRTAPTLFRFGDIKFAAKDYEGALGYYRQIDQNYSNAPIHADALSKIAFCYGELSNNVAEIKALEAYVEKLKGKEKPGHALVSANYRLAYSYKQIGEKYYPAAIKRFSELAKLINDPQNPYQNNEEEKGKNLAILESAMFHRGVCFAALTKPEDKVEAFRKEAIKTFGDLAAKFPKSQYAPKALSRMGTLWIILKNPEEAKKVYDQLEKGYADSPEAKNAAYQKGRNLLELGLRNEAVAAFKDMFGNKEGKYAPGQILQAASELHAAGEYAIAADGFAQVLAAPTIDKVMRERALRGSGACLVALGQYEEGAKALEEMVKENPRSGHTITACLDLSRAYAELAVKEADSLKRLEIFNNSIRSINKAIKLETNKVGVLRLKMGAARIGILKAKAETDMGGTPEKARDFKGSAVAAYHTIVIQDQTVPEIKPFIEEAIVAAVPLLLDIEKWEDAVEYCDRYIELFPSGKSMGEIRKWKNTSSSKRTSAPAAAPPPETEPEEPVVAPEDTDAEEAAAPAAEGEAK